MQEECDGKYVTSVFVVILVVHTNIHIGVLESNIEGGEHIGWSATSIFESVHAPQGGVEGIPNILKYMNMIC